MNYKEMSAEMKTRAAEIKPAFKFVDKAGKTWNTDSYFGMLNRTLHANVAHETYIDTLVESGFDLVRITGISSDGEKSPCYPYQGEVLSISGTSKKYGSLDDAVAAGLFHPNCCVPETLVESPDMITASRFEYSGEMIKIKYASRNSLTVTQNHMLLTDQGFAAAHTLAKGDNVLRRIEGNRLGFSCPDVDRKPSTIEDIFMAFRERSGVLSAQVPVTAEHFHGDGKFGNGNVDIITSDSLLLNNVAGQFKPEPFRKAGFAFADSELLRLAGDSSLFALLLWAARATNRIVGGPCVGGAPFRASELLRKPELFILASDIYACGNKGAPHGFLSYHESLAQFIVSNAGLIEPDSVIDVERVFYSGHVYDLQSLSTLYITNGYLSSNCVHDQKIFVEGVD